MANFVLPEKLNYDFQYELLNAIEFMEWFRPDYNDYTVYKESEDLPEDFVPVGSLEFIQQFGDIKPPVNIPEELFKDKYLKRDMEKIEVEGLKQLMGEAEKHEGMVFIKYLDQYKGLTAVMDSKEFFGIDADINEGNYLVSEYLNIKSEFRAFINNHRLIDVRRYAGPYNRDLDIGLIKDMIYEYDKDHSYTIDVAVADRGTCLIEVHPFVSCGLYGFRDYTNIPQMTIQGYNWIKDE